MDKDTLYYIFQFYFKFASTLELAAWRHYSISWKVDRFTGTHIEKRREHHLKNGDISEDPAVLALLKDGVDEFQQRVATRIFELYSHLIFLNTCPKCGKIARTPQAKQCKFCFFSWHKVVVGTFKPTRFIEFKNNRTFLVGTGIEGKPAAGQFADLIQFGFGRKPKIALVEPQIFTDKTPYWEDAALEFEELSDPEKEILRTITPTSGIFNLEVN